MILLTNFSNLSFLNNFVVDTNSVYKLSIFNGNVFTSFNLLIPYLILLKLCVVQNKNEKWYSVCLVNFENK